MNNGKSSFGNLLLGYDDFDTINSQQIQNKATTMLNGTLFGEENQPKIRIIDSKGHERQDQTDFQNASKLISLLRQHPSHTALIYVLEIKHLVSENPLNEFRLKFYKSTFKDFLKNTIFVISKWSFHKNHTDQRAKENIDENEVHKKLQKLLEAVGFENPNPTVYFIDSFYDPNDFIQRGMFNSGFESFWQHVSKMNATNILEDDQNVRDSLQKYKITHKTYQEDHLQIREDYEQMIKNREEIIKKEKE
ncbi:aig1 family protein [Stylonychia lemnae]|uniref:Aig1 family protein n=1 Tax=Stylonychia lemnae TaxID=5949 RepID=A0A078ADB5_STYLE|nr:aig1 family protein [Stylonychia lemnae]|eukprot:CDW80234.1 aig1 family protein [Stylonychia lemnae]